MMAPSTVMDSISACPVSIRVEIAYYTREDLLIAQGERVKAKPVLGHDEIIADFKEQLKVQCAVLGGNPEEWKFEVRNPHQPRHNPVVMITAKPGFELPEDIELLCNLSGAITPNTRGQY